jgi:hypothetical protein
MLDISKKDRVVYIFYSGRTFKTGLTVTASIYDDTDTLITGSPFTLTEIGTTGLYGTSFTPTALGNYKIVIFESSTKIAATTIKVTDYDVESIGEDLESALSLLATLQSTLDTNQTSNQTSFTTIISKIDSLASGTATTKGGYIA